MSAQEHLAPYLNRFVILLQQKAKARLELTWNEGKLNINIHHDIGVIHEPDKTVPQSYTDVLKKNMKQSQIRRLQKRANERAEKAKQHVPGSLKKNEDHKESEKAKSQNTIVKNEAEKN